MSTKTFSSEKEKRENVHETSREFWEPAFTTLGLSRPYFTVKVMYKPKNYHEQICRLFPSELTKGDVYLEMVDFDYNHLFQPRRLYKLRHNPDFSKIFRAEETSAGLSYTVPLSSLELIQEGSILATSKGTLVETPVVSPTPDPTAPLRSSSPTPDPFAFMEEEISDADAHYNTMTIRDYYCIKHNIPKSHKSWLNQLIKEGIQWQQNQK
jgi:hypothetical protein